MRVTVAIDDDVLAAARSLAAREGCSLGRALSELARRGLGRAEPVQTAESVADTTFAVRADAEPITNEDVAKALGDW